MSLAVLPERPSGAGVYAIAYRQPQPIADGIAAVLRERIALGAYVPGSWIREGVLGEEFGVSNGPIREALQLLVNEELLVREPRRGVRVVALNSQEIVEVFQVRLALLELAAELAAPRVTPAQLAEARVVIEPMRSVLAARDIDAQMPIGNRLSHWLCACSGNRRLASTYGRLTFQSRMYIHESLRRSQQLEALAQLWHELLEAMEAHDAGRAKRAVRALVRRALDDLGLAHHL